MTLFNFHRRRFHVAIARAASRTRFISCRGGRRGSTTARERLHQAALHRNLTTRCTLGDCSLPILARHRCSDFCCLRHTLQTSLTVLCKRGATGTGERATGSLFSMPGSTNLNGFAVDARRRRNCRGTRGGIGSGTTTSAAGRSVFRRHRLMNRAHAPRGTVRCGLLQRSLSRLGQRFAARTRGVDTGGIAQLHHQHLIVRTRRCHITGSRCAARGRHGLDPACSRGTCFSGSRFASSIFAVQGHGLSALQRQFPT